jgi:hypothetical protein
VLQPARAATAAKVSSRYGCRHQPATGRPSTTSPSSTPHNGIPLTYALVPSMGGQVADGRARQAETLGTSTPKRARDELQLRGVVERLGGDVTAAAERRDDEHRHAHPETERSGDAERLGWLLQAFGFGGAVRYSPGVQRAPSAAATWSNQPSFSSYMRNSAVLDHTSGWR